MLYVCIVYINVPYDDRDIDENERKHDEGTNISLLDVLFNVSISQTINNNWQTCFPVMDFVMNGLQPFVWYIEYKTVDCA